MTQPIIREDLCEWLKPLFDHIGTNAMNSLEIHIGLDSIEVDLIDTEHHDGPANGHMARGLPSGAGDEFTLARIRVSVPIMSRADAEPLAEAGQIGIGEAARIVNQARERFGLSGASARQIADLLKAGVEKASR